MVKLCGYNFSKPLIAAVLLTALLLIGSIVVMSVGGVLIHYAGDIENLPNFAETNCTIAAVEVATLIDCGTAETEYSSTRYTEWTAVWQCQESGASIVENPFSSRSYRSWALNDRGDYTINSTAVVMCNIVDLPCPFPVVEAKALTQCQVWSTCFFDVEMVKYMQENSESDQHKGYILLFTGIAIMVISACMGMAIVYRQTIYESTTYTQV